MDVKDDGDNYFDVNTKTLAYCGKVDNYIERFASGEVRGDGSIIKRRQVTQVNLERYTTLNEPKDKFIWNINEIKY